MDITEYTPRACGGDVDSGGGSCHGNRGCHLVAQYSSCPAVVPDISLWPAQFPHGSAPPPPPHRPLPPPPTHSLLTIPPPPSLAPFRHISLTTAHPPSPHFISQSSGGINRGNTSHWGVYLVVCVCVLLLLLCFHSNDPHRLTGGASRCVALGFTDPGHQFSTPLQPSRSKTHCMLHSVRPATQEAFRVCSCPRLFQSWYNGHPGVRNKSPNTFHRQLISKSPSFWVSPLWNYEVFGHKDKLCDGKRVS